MERGEVVLEESLKLFQEGTELVRNCQKLLDEKRVALVPGSAFGAGSEGFARISYAYSIDHLTIALDRIEEFIKDLK